MQSTLNFEYQGKEYNLCYNNAVLKRLDKSGFLGMVHRGDLVLTATEELFIASFEARHASTPHSLRREIFSNFSDTAEDGTLLDTLLEMLLEVQEAMKPQGNIKWKVVRG